MGACVSEVAMFRGRAAASLLLTQAAAAAMIVIPGRLGKRNIEEAALEHHQL